MAHYDEVAAAIANGEAQAHALWILLSNERDRDAYALKPEQWEGAGEYQRVSYSDGRSVLVRIPMSRRSFKCSEAA